jgi:hypothetical protein
MSDEELSDLLEHLFCRPRLPGGVDLPTTESAELLPHHRQLGLAHAYLGWGAASDSCRRLMRPEQVSSRQPTMACRAPTTSVAPSDAVLSWPLRPSRPMRSRAPTYAVCGGGSLRLWPARHVAHLPPGWIPGVYSLPACPHAAMRRDPSGAAQTANTDPAVRTTTRRMLESPRPRAAQRRHPR